VRVQERAVAEPFGEDRRKRGQQGVSGGCGRRCAGASERRADATRRPLLHDVGRLAKRAAAAAMADAEKAGGSGPGLQLPKEGNDALDMTESPYSTNPAASRPGRVTPNQAPVRAVRPTDGDLPRHQGQVACRGFAVRGPVRLAALPKGPVR